MLCSCYLDHDVRSVPEYRVPRVPSSPVSRVPAVRVHPLTTLRHQRGRLQPVLHPCRLPRAAGHHNVRILLHPPGDSRENQGK